MFAWVSAHVSQSLTSALVHVAQLLWQVIGTTGSHEIWFPLDYVVSYLQTSSAVPSQFVHGLQSLSR